MSFRADLTRDPSSCCSQAEGVGPAPAQAPVPGPAPTEQGFVNVLVGKSARRIQPPLCARFDDTLYKQLFPV